MQLTSRSFLSFASVLLVMAPVAQDPAAPDGADDAQRLRSEEFGADLDRAFGAMQGALRELPRETFDVKACSAQVGADPESAFAWVRDETRWIAYQGALRGAKGVLLDRMGSHLDRALLLARLLEHAGHEVELARRTLSDDEAEELAEIARAELPGLPDSDDDSEARTLAELTQAAELLKVDLGQVAKYAFEAQAKSDRMVETVHQRGAEQSRALATALGWPVEEETAAPWAPDAESLAALCDHWWVRVRSGDGWSDLDPSRRSHVPGDRIGEGDPDQTYAADELPDELFHRVRIEVRGEQTTPAGRAEHVALSHELRVADSVCETLTLAWVPIGAPPVKGQDAEGAYSPEVLQESALAVSEWLPLLASADGVVKVASLRADGSINKDPAMGFIGESFARGLNALQGGGDPKKQLTAVFVDFEILAPGRGAASIRRSIFDLVGPAARAKADTFEISEELRLRRGLALLSSTRTLLQPCWPSEEFVINRWLTGQLQNRRAQLLATSAAGRGDSAGVRSAMQGARPSDGSLLMLASQRRDRSPFAGAIALTQVNLLGSYELIASAGQTPLVQRGFDILRNEVGVLPESPHPANRVRLGQGVVDTVLEAELLDGEGPVQNASRSFAATLARKEAVTPIVDSASLAALGGRLTPDNRVQIEDALESGFVAVLAEAPSDGAPVHWWRIDPRGGTCLGIGVDGRGQGSVEFIGLVSLGMTTIGGLSCIDSTDSDRMGCCMGLWIAGMAGEAALALYLGGPVGAGVALGVAIFYSVWLADACD